MKIQKTECKVALATKVLPHFPQTAPKPHHWPNHFVSFLLVGWLVPAVGLRELKGPGEGLGGPVVAGSPGMKLPGRSQRKTEPLIPARNRSRCTHVRPTYCSEMCNISPDVLDYHTHSCGQRW